MVIFHSYVSLPEVKVKVLLVTLELDQHWLHAKKKIGAGAWTLMSAARRKLGRRVEMGLEQSFEPRGSTDWNLISFWGP